MIIKSFDPVLTPNSHLQTIFIKLIKSHTTEKFFLMTLSPDSEEDSYESDVIKKKLVEKPREQDK